MRMGIYGRSSAEQECSHLSGVLVSRSLSLSLSLSPNMSCLDVMYHHSYGASYLPYKAAYQHQQQRKPGSYSKVQECVDQQMQQQLHQRAGGPEGTPPMERGPRRGPRTSAGSPDHATAKDGSQPAEAEYLNARCVLFTYFRGSIGDVVDEHFSRALSQSSSFARETKPIRVTHQPPAPACGGLWKDGVSLSEGPCSPVPSNIWTSAYPSQASPCLPSSTISVHPDYPTSPLPFHPADSALWAGHPLAQAGLPESWSYSLGGQSPGGYPQIHDIYPHPSSVHGHAHMHGHGHRFPHAMLHSFPPHSPALDPRFGPLLLPGARSQSQAAPSAGGAHGTSVTMDGVKTEDCSSSISVAAAAAVLPASWSSSALHGALEVYDSGLDQEKSKAPAWF